MRQHLLRHTFDTGFYPLARHVSCVSTSAFCRLEPVEVERHFERKRSALQDRVGRSRPNVPLAIGRVDSCMRPGHCFSVLSDWRVGDFSGTT